MYFIGNLLIVATPAVFFLIGFFFGKAAERTYWKKQLDWARKMEEQHGKDWVEKLTERSQRTMWL